MDAGEEAAKTLADLSALVDFAQVRTERDALLRAAQGVIPLVCGRRQAGVSMVPGAWQALADVLNEIEDRHKPAPAAPVPSGEE